MNLHFSRHSIALAAVLAAAALSGCATAKFDDDQQALLKAAKRAGATAVEARQYDDGGMQLSGELEGRAFALSIPWRWNRQAVLYASGYSIPGTPLKIPDNALRDDRIGLSRTPYAERFAVGRSAYDKAGMGVQTAVENTWRLKQFMDRLGTSKVYVIGGSMGGSITMALIEKHPDAFAGAIAACGVVGDWQAELGYAIDVRAAYNYFTRGTAYELPGEKSVARSALSTFSSGPLHWTWPLPQLIQAKRLIKPVLRLFDAAAANPQGPERRIIDNIAAAAGTQADPASFTWPIATVGLGMDDMNRTFGGSIYDNSAKVYSSPYLSARENAALNAGIERIHADPAAVAYANQWYKSTGVFSTRLLTLYNVIDPEVPSGIQEPMLREAATRAGNTGNLVQRAVPAMRQPLFAGIVKNTGYVHCGFTAEQVAQAWDDVRVWVETGQKPE